MKTKKQKYSVKHIKTVAKILDMRSKENFSNNICNIAPCIAIKGMPRACGECLLYTGVDHSCVFFCYKWPTKNYRKYRNVFGEAIKSVNEKLKKSGSEWRLYDEQ